MAAILVGGLLALGPTRADAPRAPGLACPAPGWLACRHPRAARTGRAVVAEARMPTIDPAAYGPGRYVSLLILGVGY